MFFGEQDPSVNLILYICITMRKDIILAALIITLLASCAELDELFGKDDKLKAGTASTAVTDDGQLYNMGFDLWCYDGGDPEFYDSLATDDQKKVWGSANSSTASFGKPTCTPDSVMVAVEGEGKYAVKLQTQLINAVITKKLAAGSIFTGSMGSVSLTSLTATLKWGIPFTLKPKALEGYACYQPKSINVADKAHGDLKGTLDKGHVFVMLTDWDKQFTVDPAKEKFVAEDDEHVIGYGKVTFETVMEGYEKFRIDIDYRDDRTPKFVVIVGSSSVLGDYFTGGEGSTLYLDEFKFIY